MPDNFQLQIFCDDSHVDNIYFETFEEANQFIIDFQIENLNEEVQKYITIDTIEFNVYDLINDKLVYNIIKRI